MKNATNVVSIQEATQTRKARKPYRRVSYPKNTNRYAQRPIRLWDCRRSKVLKHYYFKDETKSIEAALKIVNWARVDEAIDVYHSISLRHIAQFKKRVDGTIYTWFAATVKVPTTPLKD